jgi:hypothetical protein
MTLAQEERKRITNHLWYLANKSRLRAIRIDWRRRNATKCREYYKQYRSLNKEKCKEAVGKWKRSNPTYWKQYQSEHREQTRAYENAWKKSNRSKVRLTEKRHLDKNPNRRLRTNLSRRIRRALNGFVKKFSTAEFTGCTLEELRSRVSSQFKPGMSWDNYGTVWHIDHILPCASFDLSKLEDQRRCFHFSNLQPLFAIENIQKGARIQ